MFDRAMEAAPPWRTLVDLLRDRAIQDEKAPAYTFLKHGEMEETRLTYDELERQARAIAASLKPYAKPGDRALLVCPAGLDYIAAFFGCLYAGVVAVPAYPSRANRSLGRLQSIIA